MPVPARYQTMFGPALQPGEELRAAANADLWLRYRRLALTDRRLLCLERGGLRNPRGGRRLSAIPLDTIQTVAVHRNRIQTTIALTLTGGERIAYALPTFSKGTTRFCAAIARAAQKGV